jgi:hypothetical protein
VPKLTLPALLLCLPLTALLPGRAPARPPVRQLIDQLGDRNYARRRQAEDGLRAEGARALPALKQALDHPDAEVRRRVRELVPALETQALLGPKRVTLKLTERPVGEALDEIARQTGYKIDLGTVPPGAYSFDLKEATFWEALDRVGRDAGLVLEPPAWDQRLRLTKRPGHTAHVCRDGPIRFTADSIQLYRELEFGLAGPAAEAPKRSEALTLNFTVYAEPKLPILGVGEPRLTAAYDNEKRSLLPPPDAGAAPRVNSFSGGSSYGNLGRSYSLRVRVRLCPPSATATGIAVVRGTLPLNLLVAQNPTVLADNLLADKGKPTKVGAAAFAVEEAIRRPNGVEVKLQVALAGAGAGGLTWAQTLPQRLEVQDAKGGTYSVANCGWRGSDPGHFALNLLFDAAGAELGPPRKLVYREWVTREHLASFEFKELPLP